jgi:hypothetical protein
MRRITQAPPTDPPAPLWVQVVVIAIATLLTIVILIIGFIIVNITKNPVYLGSYLAASSPIPFIWRGIIRWVFPKRKIDMEFELEKLRIKSDSKSQKKKQMLP